MSLSKISNRSVFKRPFLNPNPPFLIQRPDFSKIVPSPFHSPFRFPQQILPRIISESPKRRKGMNVVERSGMQIWDNATFEGGESWSCSFVPMPTKVCDFKENMCPQFINAGEEGNPKSGRDLDEEINGVERKISNLSEKLKALHLEKAEMERPRGGLIPVKYMEQKVLQKQDTPAKKVEDLSLSGAKVLGLSTRRVSMCPMEIYSTALKSRPSSINRLEIDDSTPTLPLQGRKKSCFWNLDEIDELKATKERRKSMASMSLSPNVGKIAPKVQPQKQALTAIGPKKGGKKEESVISSIQPKRLFKDAEKDKKKERDVLVRDRAKVVVKPGRVVASRYNQLTASAVRKRSFPENEKDEAGRVEKRRNSNEASKVKKRWEILPGDVVIYRSCEEEKETREDQEEEKAKAAETPSKIVRAGEGLRRLRVARGMIGESPRDSGAAKRVAELERRSAGRYFVKDEEGKAGEGFGQALSFTEDGKEEQERPGFDFAIVLPFTSMEILDLSH